MTTYTPILDRVRAAETLHDKSQLLTYLGRALSANRKKITPADKGELAAFALSELEEVPALLNKAACYREKDEIFGIMDSLMNLVMICYDSPAAVPPDRLEMIKRVVERYDRERFLEMAIDEVFKGNPTEADMERILCMASPLKDEFHKGQLWQGLIHYKGQVNTLSNDAKAVLARYAVSELTRFAEARREGTFTEEMKDQLEFICDAAGCLMFRAPVNPELVGLIGDLFELKDGDISYYALSTLLSVGEKVSDEVIVTLAKDIIHADLTYSLLERHSMTARFPAELRDPAYLAKSDLVHWLTYPPSWAASPMRSSFWA